MLKSLLILGVLIVPFATAQAENWPGWRGPGGQGIAAAADYPVEFSADSNLAWKIELPGRGSSAPAVWGDQIIVTTPIDGQDGIVCLDFAGTELWRQTLGAAREGKHRNASGNNPSPTTDGEYLVVYFKSGRLACLNLDGDVRWLRNLQVMYGKDTLWWDLGTSPVIADGKVIIAVMQDGDSYLAAFDIDTGNVVWKQPRQYDCAEESDHAYSTPSIVSQAGGSVIVTWGADHLTGHDLATGKPLWECGGFNPESQSNRRVIASAVVDDQLAIVPYERGKLLAAVKLDAAQGDITATHRQWELEEIGADVPTPIIDGERLLLLSDRGPLYGLDKLTGDKQWELELPKTRNKYYASPVLGGDLLYCTREDGVIMTCRLTGDGAELLAENNMEESIIATPVPIRGKLLVRGMEHLFLIGE